MIHDGAWAGHPAFVVGGGPSLRGFDFSKLRDRRVIALNRAFEKTPGADYAMILDRRLLQALQKEEIWQNHKGMKIWLSTGKGGDLNYAAPNPVLQIHTTKIWSASIKDGIMPGSPSGANAGLAGISLADILGAETIYLLGFDMKGEGGRSASWHGKYPDHWRGSDRCYTRFLHEFDAQAKNIKAKVVNLNPGSALKTFSFGSIDDVLGKAVPA